MPSDTPTSRATINQLTIDALDEMLAAIRERRLVRVKKLEQLAQAKADDVRLTEYLKFEKEYARVQKMMAKHVAEEAKIEAALHKLRLHVMAMDMAA